MLGGLCSERRCPLEDGQARLRIDAFALTSNNVTYAAFRRGDELLGRSFPLASADTGCIPVWGFADVIESRADGRGPWASAIYGYWPMADEVVLQPTRVSEAARLCRRRDRTGGNVARNLQPVHPVQCRPRLPRRRSRHSRRCCAAVHHLVPDRRLPGRQRSSSAPAPLVLSSASSKTAYGTAHLPGAAARCKLRRCASSGSRRAANLAVHAGPGRASTRCLPYDALIARNARNSSPTVYVDFSGDAALRAPPCTRTSTPS